jgi:hypothetical protein
MHTGEAHFSPIPREECMEILLFAIGSMIMWRSRKIFQKNEPENWQQSYRK